MFKLQIIKTDVSLWRSCRSRIRRPEAGFLHQLLESVFGTMRFLARRLFPRLPTKADFLPVIVFLFARQKRNAETG